MVSGAEACGGSLQYRSAQLRQSCRCSCRPPGRELPPRARERARRHDTRAQLQQRLLRCGKGAQAAAWARRGDVARARDREVAGRPRTRGDRRRREGTGIEASDTVRPLRVGSLGQSEARRSGAHTHRRRGGGIAALRSACACATTALHASVMGLSKLQQQLKKKEKERKEAAGKGAQKELHRAITDADPAAAVAAATATSRLQPSTRCRRRHSPLSATPCCRRQPPPPAASPAAAAATALSARCAARLRPRAQLRR